MRIFIPFLAVAFAVGLLAGGTFFSQIVTIEKEQPLTVLTEGGALTSHIRVPAVDEKGDGVITDIGVSVEPGSGRTLASIENILFFIDTQNSIRIAKDVAQEVTGIDLADRDLIYTITANASVIEGPSAGAALTIATIAALQGKDINPEVMITGTIAPDGSIGRVGQVAEKAKVAREAGAKIFLVPRGTGIQQGFEYQKEMECRVIGGTQICETAYVRKRSSSNGMGVEVREVGTIQEALSTFLAEGGGE